MVGLAFKPDFSGIANAGSNFSSGFNSTFGAITKFQQLKEDQELKRQKAQADAKKTEFNQKIKVWSLVNNTLNIKSNKVRGKMLDRLSAMFPNRKGIQDFADTLKDLEEPQRKIVQESIINGLKEAGGGGKASEADQILAKKANVLLDEGGFEAALDIVAEIQKRTDTRELDQVGRSGLREVLKKQSGGKTLPAGTLRGNPDFRKQLEQNLAKSFVPERPKQTTSEFQRLRNELDDPNSKLSPKARARTRARLNKLTEVVGKTQFDTDKVATRKLDDQRVGTKRAVATIDDVIGLLEKHGSKILSVTGTAGRLTRSVQAQLKAASGVFALQGNSLSRSFGKAVHSENMVVKSRVLKELGDIGIQSARLRGMVINIAFARALTFNPDGRISEPDFRNALKSIGAKTGDKESFIAVLMDTRKSVIRTLGFREDILRKPITKFKDRKTSKRRIKFDASGNIISGDGQ